jgi:hypothetical protein
MSKMTQRRMARRASRKLNVARRENRFLRLLAGWRDDNIDQLTKALKRALGRAETAPAGIPAAQ